MGAIARSPAAQGAARHTRSDAARVIIRRQDAPRSTSGQWKNRDIGIGSKAWSASGKPSIPSVQALLTSFATVQVAVDRRGSRSGPCCRERVRLRVMEATRSWPAAAAARPARPRLDRGQRLGGEYSRFPGSPAHPCFPCREKESSGAERHSGERRGLNRSRAYLGQCGTCGESFLGGPDLARAELLAGAKAIARGLPDKPLGCRL